MKCIKNSKNSWKEIKHAAMKQICYGNMVDPSANKLARLCLHLKRLKKDPELFQHYD